MSPSTLARTSVPRSVDRSRPRTRTARRARSILLGALGVSLGVTWPHAPSPAQVLAPKPGALGARAGGAVEPDRLRRLGPGAGVALGAGGRRRSAGVHRAAPHLPQPREPHARGTLPHHAAVGRDHQPLRDARGRPLARGRGRRAAGGAHRVRGLPAPAPGPGAAGDRGRQRVLGAGLPDPTGVDKGAHRLVFAGADTRERALPPAAARIAQARQPVDPRAGGKDGERARRRARVEPGRRAPAARDRRGEQA